MIPSDKTIFPKLPLKLSKGQLHEYYSPTQEEIEWTCQRTVKNENQLLLLSLYKLFQRLGYFVSLTESPLEILSHIATFVNSKVPNSTFLNEFDNSRKKDRYMQAVREKLAVKFFSRKDAINIADNITRIKSNIVDIINATIENLINLNIELPDFHVIEKICIKSRERTNSIYFSDIFNRISEGKKNVILNTILIYFPDGKSGWHKLKEEPSKFGIKTIREIVEHVIWLNSIKIPDSAFFNVPEVKLESLFEEFLSFDFFRVRRMGEIKKIVITAIMIKMTSTSHIDDLADMFIKTFFSLEKAGKDDYIDYKIKRIQTASHLVSKFSSVVDIYMRRLDQNSKIKKLDGLLVNDAGNLSEMCGDFNAYEKYGHLHFVEKIFSQNYSVYMSFLNVLIPQPANSSVHIDRMYKWINTARRKAGNAEYVGIKQTNFNKAWIKGKWKKFVLSRAGKVAIKRFELYFCMQMANALKSRDIFIVGSNRYSDYRRSLITWPEYREKINEYCEIANLPTTQKNFVNFFSSMLKKSCEDANEELEEKGGARIQNGKLKLKKVKSTEPPKGFKAFEEGMSKKLNSINLLDIIGHVCKSLKLHTLFKPALSSNIKPSEYFHQVVATLFCYGCNLNATEAEKSIVDTNKREIYWINSNHISEEKLEKCISFVVNEYNKFALPKYWGNNKTVSVDGTKWEAYSNNLVTEYHIRYRGYGGIAYYHVSDTYIALYSNFISCGVYEGRFLLDGLEENSSDIRPEIVHGDTHAQSLVIFALAFLLGIKIMPRIRKINNLNFYKADSRDSYEKLSSVFCDKSIDWKLIGNYMRDMLRVVLSIKEGKVKASNIIGRLNASSRGNKLYLAFRELGRVLRTSYLLNYVGDFDLRKTVHAATCKSEEFNDYVKWIAFADNTIRKNNRLEQRKFIKYNHLVTNMVLLYNVQVMSGAISKHNKQKQSTVSKFLKYLSPYRKIHIIRLGRFELDLSKNKDTFETWNYEL